jgi:hypothetical protein
LLVPEAHFAFVGLANSGRGWRAIDPLRDLALRLACGIEPQERARGEVDRDALAAAPGLYRGHMVEVRLERVDGDLRVTAVEEDPFTGAQVEHPAAVARGAGPRLLRIEGGEDDGTLVELLAPDLLRIGGAVVGRAG